MLWIDIVLTLIRILNQLYTLMPIKIWIQIRPVPQVVLMLENLKILTFIYSRTSLHRFFFLVSISGVIIFNILDIILKFSGKVSFCCNRSGSAGPDADPVIDISVVYLDSDDVFVRQNDEK
jgi:hypothetical protein